jgi:hypothetical protein
MLAKKTLTKHLKYAILKSLSINRKGGIIIGKAWKSE